VGFKDSTHQKGFRRYWPVVGFFLVIALGALAWIAAPSIIQTAKSMFPQFDTHALPELHMRLGFAAFTFFIMVAVVALVLAIFAPKRKLESIKDADLVKDRAAMIKQKEFEKRRQRRVNQQMREK
jgi:uncharacterized BrkB/YihY/UPF0761 family membrane protein